MPWYDGLTDDEIQAAIDGGKAPGSAQQGGVVEVPQGYLDRQYRRQQDDWWGDWLKSVRESINAPLREAIAKGLEDWAAECGFEEEPGVRETLERAAERVRNKEWEQ